MNTQTNLADRIWTAHVSRQRRQRRLAGVTLGGTLALTLGLVSFWPRPSLALSDVVIATNSFQTVSWEQAEEGVVTDINSPNPKRVPWFSRSRRNLVSRNPINIQQYRGEWNEWRGLNFDGSTLRYEKGSSQGLTSAHLAAATSEFSFSDQFDRQAAEVSPIVYEGRNATAFQLRDPSRRLSIVLYADNDTKRLMWLNLEIQGSEGERIFTRTISNIRYDQASP